MAMAWISINNNPKQLNEAGSENYGAAVAVRPALRLLHVPVASCVISECAILLFLNDIKCWVQLSAPPLHTQEFLSKQSFAVLSPELCIYVRLPLHLVFGSRMSKMRNGPAEQARSA